MPALLALRAVRDGGSAVPAASGSGRAVERHGRALRRGQLGVRRGLPAEPDWGALLLPARHPALDARCGCSRRGGGVRGGMRGGVLVGQQHGVVRGVHGAASDCFLDCIHQSGPLHACFQYLSLDVGLCVNSRVFFR